MQCKMFTINREEEVGNIKVKFSRLFAVTENGFIDLQKANPELENLINIPATHGGSKYDLGVKLRKAVDKARKEVDETIQKFYKEGSAELNIIYESGKTDKTFCKIIPVTTHIENERERTNKIKKEMKIGEEEVNKYFGQLEKLLGDLDEKQKDIIVKSVEGEEQLERMIVSNQFNIINQEELTKQVNELLQEETILNCYPIKISKLENEICPNVNFAALEEFIEDDRK